MDPQTRYLLQKYFKEYKKDIWAFSKTILVAHMGIQHFGFCETHVPPLLTSKRTLKNENIKTNNKKTQKEL